jgi:hypothetical protein
VEPSKTGQGAVQHIEIEVHPVLVFPEREVFSFQHFVLHYKRQSSGLFLRVIGGSGHSYFKPSEARKLPAECPVSVEMMETDDDTCS